MRIVLLDNIKGVGHAGEVKDVSDGYARNFLFPRRTARPATHGAIRDTQTIRAKKLQVKTIAIDQAREAAQKLAGARVQMVGKANEHGTLFAGIESEDIAVAVSSVAGMQIGADAIRMNRNIKTIGEHRVGIELADGVISDVIVSITAE